MLLGIAKLEVSVLDTPRHGVVDKVTGGDRVGAGTGNRGLRPGAIAPDGVVASLKFGVAKVLEGASMGTVLLTRELVSVESVVLTMEAESVVVVVGLQVPAIVDVPNGEVIGSGATEGVKERDDEVITLPVAPTALLPAVIVVTVLLAGVVAVLVVPIVGHTVIVPSELPGIGPKLPV